VCCQTAPAPTTSAPIAVSDFSKALFGGYFTDDALLADPTLDALSSATSMYVYPPLSCAAMGGACTTDSVCAAGSSQGYNYGKAADTGDCLADASGAPRQCCGSAQQLWAQQDVLVIDVPSTSDKDIPGSPSSDQLTEIRLAAEFKLVLQSLGEPAGASQYRIPIVPKNRHQLKAGEKPKPVKRPAGYESGGFVNIDL
jgi:hypothetical protein